MALLIANKRATIKKHVRVGVERASAIYINFGSAFHVERSGARRECASIRDVNRAVPAVFKICVTADEHQTIAALRNRRSGPCYVECCDCPSIRSKDELV